jgi:hypothetical protein
VDSNKWIQSHISLSAALGSIQFSHCNVYLLEGALDPRPKFHSPCLTNLIASGNHHHCLQKVKIVGDH